MDVKTTLPIYNAPLIDAAGNIHEVWWRFFNSLLDRTGGGEGVDISQLVAGLKLLAEQLSSERTEQAARVSVTRPPNDPLPSPVAVSRRFISDESVIVMTHGQRYDPGLHAVATTTDAGFMSSSDKAKLDSITSSSGDWDQVAKASLPTPSTANRGARRFVTDATGSTGIIPAYCTGTAWKRFSDDSTVN